MRAPRSCWQHGQPRAQVMKAEEGKWDRKKSAHRVAEWAKRSVAIVIRLACGLRARHAGLVTPKKKVTWRAQPLSIAINNGGVARILAFELHTLRREAGAMPTLDARKSGYRMMLRRRHLLLRGMRRCEKFSQQPCVRHDFNRPRKEKTENAVCRRWMPSRLRLHRRA
jgi:hypothetical protein